MKKCFKCGKRKKITEFYSHKEMGDGHLGKCKKCTKADVRRHRVENPEKLSAYERRRLLTTSRKKQRAESQRKSRAKHPEKEIAYRAVRKAVRTGVLKPERCACGEKRVQAHHYDYGKPLDVKWQCFKCHRQKEHGHIVVSSRETWSFQGQPPHRRQSCNG